MPSPIINDVVPFEQYSASSGQTIFVYPFAIFEDADVKVYKRGVSSSPSDATQLLQFGVDYTVTSAGSDSGGNIILTTGATAGDIITVIRNLALERRTVFQPGTLTDAALNEEFNNVLAMIQDVNMTLAKIIPGYNYSAIFDLVNKKLPTLPANHMWRMNSLATGIETVELPDSDPGASILRADLASHNAGKGASLIGVAGGAGTVQDFIRDVNEIILKYGIDTGAANSVTAEVFSGVLTEYTEDNIYLIRILHNNTGATTVNFNSIGDIPLRYQGGSELYPNDLIAGKLAMMVFSGADDCMTLINPNFLNIKASVASAYLEENYELVAPTAKVPFNIAQYDDNVYFDSVNNRFVFKKIGTYSIGAYLENLITDTEFQVAVYINGNFYRNIGRGSTGGGGDPIGYSSYGSTKYKSLAVTDYAEIFIGASLAHDVTVIGGIARSYFEIEYLGAN